MRQISLCLTNYNRLEVLNAYDKVYADERISEIIISDDASDLELFNKLKDIIEFYPKVKLYRNLTNQDCYRNKAIAIGYATNQYVIILDSDNQIDLDYIDKIFEQEWSEDTILAPDFAMPHFDFRGFSDIVVSKENVAQYMDKPMFSTALNAMNFFINKHTYLKAFDTNTDPVTSDSIFINSRLIEQGNKIHIVKGMHYIHNVHNGSHYQNNVHRTPYGFHEKIENILRVM